MVTIKFFTWHDILLKLASPEPKLSTISLLARSIIIIITKIYCSLMFSSPDFPLVIRWVSNCHEISQSPRSGDKTWFQPVKYQPWNKNNHFLESEWNDFVAKRKLENTMAEMNFSMWNLQAIGIGWSLDYFLIQCDPFQQGWPSRDRIRGRTVELAYWNVSTDVKVEGDNVVLRDIEIL